MLRVEKLNYEVKGRKLLRDVSFQIRKGEVLALLGANGAGKSTLMKLLCGEYKPTNGVVTLHGKKLDSYDPRILARGRAMLSQQQHVSLAFTAGEIVMMGRYPHFKSSPSLTDKEVVNEVMALCGVDTLADRVFMSLSGGEQQRVQLARTLAQVWENPDSLLLLDEPISALDMHYQQKVLAIAKALSRKGFIVVLVVHDVNFAATYADRVIMLKHGRKLFDGTPVEVLNPANIYTVFSVEASVELNPRTLRPYIRLEEMPVDAFKINSKLSTDHLKHVPLKQRREQLLAQDPYLSISEQAEVLRVPEAELWMMDKGRHVNFINQSLESIIPKLSSLGEVSVYTRNACCTQKTVQQYTTAMNDGYAPHISTQSPIVNALRHDLAEWHAGFLVKEVGDEGLHFFDDKGMLIHGLQLCDTSDRDAFCAITAWLEAKQDEKPQFGPSSTAAKHHPQSNNPASQNAKEEIGINEVRKIFAEAVANSAMLEITTMNRGCVHSYIGTIKNLIDQGFRYMIKDDRMELELRLPLVEHIFRSVSSAEEDVLEFFDQHGVLALRISNRSKEKQIATSRSVRGNVVI
ncbi:heme ABC transporter ATP-binding protein [Sphingobacterium deserti]|uniref:Hemin transport system ATP-binding protein n=1 Tax=Sphingobacterium deserti TaxID=1229276 RepID=A0A0B8T5W2_9SPHI|nr:heme ABC transporter ATP-binding protein [Sphingobacterium deserti]KGE12340.1 hemin transport system ATP-binding protein [Sphingobacterium deserti]